VTRKRGKSPSSQPAASTDRPTLSGERAAALSEVRTLRPLIVGLLAVVTFLLGCVPIADTDLWWHLKTGEWILDTGQIPYVDLYTFTQPHQPWIDLHWGFQVVFATVHRLAGISGLVIVNSLVLTAAALVGWHATRQRLPPWLSGAIWALAAISLNGRSARPEIFSLLFLAAWLWLMERLDEHPRWTWWLPALQVLWINMHALFVLGLVVGGCRAVDELVRRWACGRWGLSPANGTLSPVRVGYTGILCTLAALANPYFEEGALFPLVLYRKFSVEQEFYAQHIGEFQLPYRFFLQHGFQNLYLNVEITLWLVAAGSFLWLAACCRRWSLYRLLLFAGFSHLAWEASRNANLFALVGATVACANLNDWWSLRHRANRAGWSPADAVFAGLLGLWILAIPSGYWHRWAGEEKSFGFGERKAWFPHAAARFAGQPDFPPRAFAAHFGVASVYTYHNGPERKVFMDGRLEVCSRQTFEAFNAILQAMALLDRSWEAELRDEQGRLPVVLLDSRSSRPAINGLLTQPNWRLVFADPSCAVFLETTEAERLRLPEVDYSPLLRPPKGGE
jgi:hypothetical protein